MNHLHNTGRYDFTGVNVGGQLHNGPMSKIRGAAPLAFAIVLGAFAYIKTIDRRRDKKITEILKHHNEI
jgi:hypothetical protein